MRLRLSFIGLLSLLFVSVDANAHEPREPAESKENSKPSADTDASVQQAEEDPLEVTIVAEKRGTEAASRTVVGRRELELRPRKRPGDILEAVPGLFAVQHAGGGKANQYFLRGFDADHGTDVAFSVDGIPVNNVSHGHGQGYSDFHFLIPELVVSLDAFKGPYYAGLGDFATAGAVNLSLAERFQESFAQFEIGQFGIARGLIVESPDLGDHFRAVLAAEYFRENGPFLNPERLERINLFARATYDLTHRAKIALTLMSYGSTWNGSGQIPARAVCGEGEAAPGPASFGQPCLDHFGFVDPTEGGATQRQSAQLTLTSAWQNADFSAMLYLVRYRFALFSNFTFFRDDPLQGDQIEQSDSRTTGGMDLRVRRQLAYQGLRLTATLGAQVRADGIENGLYHDAQRKRLETKTASEIGESQIGLYAEGDLRVRKWLRFVLGARAQRLDVKVDDRRAIQEGASEAQSGVKGATAFLPKAMAAIAPSPKAEVYVSWGRGFHSNDARTVVAGAGTTLITPAVGYELGLRASPIENLSLTASAFLLDLASELVWVGDEGTTEASRQSRRYGVELGARYRLSNWLFADADATFTRARYRANAGNGDAVALAPTRTLTLGISARPTIGAFTPFGAVRVKAIGERPANEEGTLVAQGFTIVDANAGLRYRNVEAAVDVQNALNAKWREVQFASESRLPYEPSPVTGIHYTPGWPRTVMGRVSLYW